MSSLLYYITSFIFHRLWLHILCFRKLSILFNSLHLFTTCVLAAGMTNLELIDPVVDAKHRSHLVDGQLPPPLRLRTHDECWSLDARWLSRFVNLCQWVLVFICIVLSADLIHLFCTGWVRPGCYRCAVWWSRRGRAVFVFRLIAHCCQP